MNEDKSIEFDLRILDRHANDIPIYIYGLSYKLYYRATIDRYSFVIIAHKVDGNDVDLDECYQSDYMYSKRKAIKEAKKIIRNCEKFTGNKLLLKE